MYKHIQTSIGEIYLWKAENYLARITAGDNKRSIERAEVRVKLKELGYSNDLLYNENGQPYLLGLDHTYLSISHSNGIIAIYIANQPVGIDVEQERKSMFEGKSYFVNNDEELLDLTQHYLQLIWGAKESFYKKMEGQIDDLKNNVTVFSTDFLDKTVQVKFKNKNHQLKFEIIDEMYLVYI